MADRKNRLAGMIGGERGAAPAQPAELTPTARAPLSQMRALLFAPPPAPAGAYATILQSEGIDVLMAPSPDTAAVLLDTSSPGLIVAVVPVLGDSLRELFETKAPQAEVRVVTGLGSLLKDAVIPPGESLDFCVRALVAVVGLLSSEKGAPRERTARLVRLVEEAAASLGFSGAERARARLLAALHEIPDVLSGETPQAEATIATLVDDPEPLGRWDVLSQFGVGIGSPFELGAASPEGDPKTRPPTAHELTEAAAAYVTLVEKNAPRPAFELRRQVGGAGLHPGAVEAIVAAAGGDQAAATRGQVLVVDADPVARHLLALRLGNEGYDVETVADGRSALESVRAKPPSAVLSETVLAGLDGFGLLDAMKREGHGAIPFVFVSSRSDPLSTNKGLLLGAVDFLAKPVNTEVLLTKLQKLMGEALRRADVSARITLSDVEHASLESFPAVSYDELVPGVSVMARFRLLADLGEGGMGKVFKAHDERLEEDVVIKVMKDSLTGDPKVLEHFKREIRLARKISHPSVVRIYDFWEAGPLSFVTMEFLEGVDLRHEIKRRGAFPLPVAIRLATELFEGLAAAHDIGVVHRDIKPHNVLLLAGGHVKILDFGIAQGLDPTSPDAKTITATPVGTPEYMSPEQLLGEKLDAKTDLYSAGVVLFELLTGRLPFAGEDRMQTATLRLQTDAPAPSFVKPGIPPAVDRAVLRLLARGRGDRPESAQAALAELRQLRGLA